MLGGLDTEVKLKQIYKYRTPLMSNQSCALSVKIQLRQTYYGNKNEASQGGVWWMSAGHEKQANRELVYVCGVKIWQSPADISFLEWFCWLCDQFPNKWSKTFYASYPEEQCQIFGYTEYCEEQGSVFTSSLSIFRVARRDCSCWNLNMSSPFTGGCTEIWHTWGRKTNHQVWKQIYSFLFFIHLSSAAEQHKIFSKSEQKQKLVNRNYIRVALGRQTTKQVLNSVTSGWEFVN